MEILWRVENPKTGAGPFQDLNLRNDDRIKLFAKHELMDVPFDDPRLRAYFIYPMHYCAYKSWAELKHWIIAEDLKILTEEYGYVIQKLTVRTCYFGQDQAVFLKDDVLLRVLASKKIHEHAFEPYVEDLDHCVG
jgi:hypothetical protein